MAIDIPYDSIKNLKVPSGNEASAFKGYWKPGGRTYPGICQKQLLMKHHGENLQLEN